MPYLNQVCLMGNLTRDPELRHIQGGYSVCDFCMAINKKNNGKDEVCYVDIVAWGRIGENCNRYLSKASCVLVQGYLKLESWNSGGSARTKLKVIAENVQFVSAPNHEGEKKNINTSNCQEHYEGKYAHDADDIPF